MPGLRSKTITRTFDAPLNTIVDFTVETISTTFAMPKFKKSNKVLLDADITFTSDISASVIAYDNPFFPTGYAAAQPRHLFEFNIGDNNKAFDTTNLYQQFAGGNATFGGSTLLPFSGTATTSSRMINDLDVVNGKGQFDIDALIVGGPTGIGGLASMGKDDLTLTISITDDYIAKKAITQGSGKSEKLSGTNKRDMIEAKGGSDRVVARNGDDIVNAGRGNDKFIGGRGDDDLRGQGGKDRLLGSKGDDQLLGGRGADILKGGTGRDILRGDQGVDQLTGGRGADIFVFTKAGQGDVVADFNSNIDRIDLSNFGFTNFEEDVALRQRGDDLRLVYDGKTIATLEDTTLATVDFDSGVYIV